MVGNFWVRKKFGRKLFWSKQIFVKKILGQQNLCRIFFVSKKLAQKFVWEKIISGQKKICVGFFLVKKNGVGNFFW